MHEPQRTRTLRKEIGVNGMGIMENTQLLAEKYRLDIDHPEAHSPQEWINILCSTATPYGMAEIILGLAIDNRDLLDKYILLQAKEDKAKQLL